ncbi:MAG: hypothetical protein H6Q72_3372 [Firmicutes bacterium]|nr:hypothetical protein [Bacillota bacterium]
MFREMRRGINIIFLGSTTTVNYVLEPTSY